MSDERTPDELESDLDAELLERVREADTGKRFSLEEMQERTKRRLTELNSLNKLMQTSRK